MQTISRRRFLDRSVMGVTAAECLIRGALQLGADPLGIPVGCQIFPVRQQLVKDFDATPQKLIPPP